MAMNKKEQAEFETARAELAIALALRWSDYEPEQIDTEKEIEGKPLNFYMNAWTYNAYASDPRTYPGWFDSVHHGDGHRTSARPSSASQRRGGPWYRTETEALMALRRAMERNFAKSLAAVDAKLAKALRA